MSGEPDIPCEHCDDSGYVERVTGGFWTGHGMKSHLSICDCICGDDVRREQSLRTPTKAPDHG